MLVRSNSHRTSILQYPDDILPAKAKELGSQDAPSYPNAAFLGINILRELWTADQQQQFSDMLIEGQRRMSVRHGRECSTFKRTMLGQTAYFSKQPCRSTYRREPA